jgi:hypothetical protein
MFYVVEDTKLMSLGISHVCLILPYVDVVEVPLTNMLNYIQP